MSPYDKGFNARLRDERLDHNPYVPDTRDHDAWNNGWHDQNDHLKSRDDALESIGWFG